MSESRTYTEAEVAAVFAKAADYLLAAADEGKCLCTISGLCKPCRLKVLMIQPNLTGFTGEARRRWTAWTLMEQRGFYAGPTAHQEYALAG